jgi:hypothetical protein
VERERRDQAEDALRDTRRDGDEVGVRERLKRREPVQPPGDRLNDTGVTHGVERLAVDAEAQRFGHAEAAAMPAEQLDPTLEGSDTHGGHIAFKLQGARRNRSVGVAEHVREIGVLRRPAAGMVQADHRAALDRTTSS